MINQRIYVAECVAEDGGAFSVSFPDVPAAITWGETLANAMTHASDALLSALAYFVENGLEPPCASDPFALSSAILARGHIALPVAAELENIKPEPLAANASPG